MKKFLKIHWSSVDHNHDTQGKNLILDAYPRISIIVPVLNRERTIGRCVQSLLDLDYPSYEVIVVDNGSTDTTKELVSTFPVRLAEEKRRGPYAARNKGIELARGELLFFTDSDCTINKDTIDKLVRNLRDENIAGVGGQIRAHEPSTLTEQYEDLAGIQVLDLPKGRIKWEKNKFLSGAIYTANAMFRKKAVLKVNGFDADFISGGDVNLCWQLQRAGYRLFFEPEAIVMHVHRNDLRGLIRQFFKYGVEQPRLLKKQPHSLSYIKCKTYLLPPFEFRCHLPLRMLITVDACNLFLGGLILTVFSSLFLYFSLLVILFVLFGTFREAIKVVKKSGELKWLALFPFFHLVRNYSFTMGRIFGGIKHRIIAF